MSSSNNGGGDDVVESGLRARFRKRKVQTDGNVEFGVAQANAYFNARRIKRSSRKPAAAARKRSASRKKPSSNSSAAAGDGHDDRDNSAADRAQRNDGDGDENDSQDDEELAFVPPSRGMVLAALKHADDRETARRAANPEHALPTFDQVRLGTKCRSCAELSLTHSLTHLLCSTRARASMGHSTFHSGAASSSRTRTCSSTASGPSSRCCRCVSLSQLRGCIAHVLMVRD